MRVSLVTLGDPNRQTGGYLYHRRLAEAAPRYGTEIRFVSFPDRVFPTPALFGRRVLGDAADADVVVVDSIATAFAAPWLRTVPRPLAAILHQGPGGIDHGAARARLQAALDRRAYRHMRLLLVASKSLRDELVGLHEDIRVLEPGRDVAATADRTHGDLRAGRDAAFLCVANWVPRKGIVELLEAFALLPRRAATLHLVGDERAHPRYGAEVRRRIERLRDRVVVHGVVSKERVAALYRAADAFVMPSFKDPYGTAYGEAMAAGLPVVGWRAGNLPYLARHQSEGLSVAPGDTAALAAALRRLAEEGDLRRTLGEAARARAESFPTWEQTAARFFSALKSIRDA
jgi:glycosyltransferase involved in cell wall biosynthesis